MDVNPKLITRPTGVFLVAVLLAFNVGRAASRPPFAFTQPATPVGPDSATLNGMAIANTNSTIAWFEWGSDISYGNVTTLTNIGTSGQVARVSASIGSLTEGGIYHYRLVASNTVTKVFGADRLLTTGIKVATWSEPSLHLPRIPTGMTNIVSQACGHGHTLALTCDGSVLAWSDPSYYYPIYGQINVPAGLTNVLALAGGYSHSLALLQGGTVSAWGKYMDGQPALVPAGLSNIIGIAGGDDHSMALKSDGTVVAWGGNSSGQTNIPARLTNVVAIASGSAHNLALRADGTVVAWGNEPSGVQQPPNGLSNLVAISTEGWHNLALRSNGTVVAWGDNGYGQSTVPAALSNVVAVAAGFDHSLALKSDGTLVAWGNTDYVASVPAGLSNVVSIASGDYHSSALSPINVPPLAFSWSAYGTPNTDLTLTLPGSDPNGDALTLRISTPPTNGTLYQFTPSGRGVPIITPDTPLVDPSRVIFAPAPDSFGAPYTTFGFIANDGQYDSQPGLETLMIVPPPLLQRSALLSGTNPRFSIGFDGLSNATYAVWASSNLRIWTFLGNATQSTSGQFGFLDSGVTNYTSRFYRIVAPAP